VCVQLADLVTYLIPGWSITEGFFEKEKRYKNLGSFLKRMAKDLKDEQKWAAEEAEERKAAIAALDPDDPNAMDEMGRTRLILAIEEHDLATVRSELARGADPNLGKRQTPLHYAVDEKSEVAIQLLLESGADPNQPPANSEELPLHVVSRRGHFELARLLVEGGADVDALSRRSERTPVAFAISGHEARLVRFLVERGADPNAIGYHGRLILCGAVDYPDMFKLLIELGADPNRLETKSLRQLRYRDRIWKVLIEAGLEVQGSDHARFASAPDSVRVLLEAGADPNATDERGLTWMYQNIDYSMAGTKKERDEILVTMRVFLENGADPDWRPEQGDDGMPYLVKAACEGWFEGVELLLEFNADRAATDDNGKTALDYVDGIRPKKKAAAARKLLEEK